MIAPAEIVSGGHVSHWRRQFTREERSYAPIVLHQELPGYQSSRCRDMAVWSNGHGGRTSNIREWIGKDLSSAAWGWHLLISSTKFSGTQSFADLFTWVKNSDSLGEPGKRDGQGQDTTRSISAECGWAPHVLEETVYRLFIGYLLCATTAKLKHKHKRYKPFINRFTRKGLEP